METGIRETLIQRRKILQELVDEPIKKDMALDSYDFNRHNVNNNEATVRRVKLSKPKKEEFYIKPFYKRIISVILVTLYQLLKIVTFLDIKGSTIELNNIFYKIYNIFLFIGLDYITLRLLNWNQLSGWNIRNDVFSIIWVISTLINVFLAYDAWILFLPFSWCKEYVYPETQIELDQPVSTKPIEGIGLSKNQKLSREAIIKGYDHLSGKYTVKILPHSSVKFNPDSQQFCIVKEAEGYTRSEIIIHINGTKPSSMEIKHTPIDSNKSSIDKYSLKHFNKQNQHYNEKGELKIIGDFKLDINKPGKYELINVYDDHHFHFTKIGNNQIDIAPCPNIELIGISNNKTEPSNYCLNHDIKLNAQIHTFGVAPLEITYSLINLETNEKYTKTIITKFKDKDEHNLLQHQDNQLNLKTIHTGKYSLKIDKVKDHFNNILYYKQLIEYNNNVETYLNVYSKPDAYFNIQNKDHLFISPNMGALSLPITLDGNDKYSVELGYCNKEIEECKSEDFKSIEIKKINNKKQYFFTVDKVGSYKILSVKDQFCSNNNLNQPIVYIPQLPKPKIEIQDYKIMSNCNKTMGLDVQVNYNGDLPFILYYKQITKINNTPTIEDKSIFINSLISYNKFIPDNSGDYNYYFYLLENEKYGKMEIDINIQQTIEAKPKAQFKFNSKLIKMCIGDKLDDKYKVINVNGNYPLELEYSITYKKDTQFFKLSDINEEEITLDLSGFKQSGKHSIQLIKIIDKDGCFNQLQETPIQIEVKDTNPIAKFIDNDNDFTIYGKEGDSFDLPIYLQGENPFLLKLLKPDNTTKNYRISNDIKAMLPNQLQGTYQLLSVRDAYCNGKIDKEDHFDIIFYDKPSVKIDDQHVQIKEDYYVKQPVCQNNVNPLDLILSGKEPFNIQYTVNTPDNNQLNRKYNMFYNLSTINLDSNLAGDYEYKIHKLADDHYTDFVDIHPIVIKQQVWELPTAQFNDEIIKETCINNELTIPIQLHGQAPFELEFKLVDPNNQVIPFQFTQIMEEQYEFKFKVPDIAGYYQLSITQIKDKQCNNNLNSKISFKAYEPPTLINNTKQPICVGDSIGYKFIGKAPFGIDYNFDGANYHQLDIKENEFERLVDSPGLFRFNQICHINEQCCTEPKTSQIEFHPLPSAKIEGKGGSITIHEGEQASIPIILSGTPPFTFQYTRKIKDKLVDAPKVTTSLKHYLLKVEEEGIIEIVNVKDKYCAYPPV